MATHRLTKERLEEIRSQAFVATYNSQVGSGPGILEELFSEIDALQNEVKILLGATDLINLAMVSDNADDLFEAVGKMRLAVNLIRGHHE